MRKISFVPRLASALGLMLAVPSATALAQSLECDGPAPVGCYEATVTGPSGETAQMSGFAQSFGSHAEDAWQARLMTPGGESGITLMHGGAGLPSTGEYLIEDFGAHAGKPPAGGFLAMGTAYLDASAASGFQSVTGTVVITASSSSWVEGTFTCEGRDPQSGATVTVEGRFKAKHQGM